MNVGCHRHHGRLRISTPFPFTSSFLFIGKQYLKNKRKCNLTQWGEKKPNTNHAQHKSTRQAMPCLPRENKGEMWDTRMWLPRLLRGRAGNVLSLWGLAIWKRPEITQKELTSSSVKERHTLTRAFSECRPALHTHYPIQEECKENYLAWLLVQVQEMSLIWECTVTSLVAMLTAQRSMNWIESIVVDNWAWPCH